MAKRTNSRPKQARSAASAAADGFQDLIDLTENLLGSLRDQSGEAVDAMREKLSATAEAARNRLVELAPDVAEAASGALARTTAFVRDDPWRAAALAAFAYIALSALTSNSDE
jgi:ElaB/YqjD/DUF883 family membrane-anchored ribosome-binding protein